MASGVDYIHPDKPRELWINEVGTASTHRGRGIGKKVVTALVEHAAVWDARRTGSHRRR